MIFLPFDGLNPYQAELSRALGAMKTAVIPAPVHPWLPLASLLWKFKDARIIHLHWLSGYMVKDSLCKSLCWSALFCMEALAAKLAGRKLVWTVHNLLEHERRYAKIELFFLKVLARHLDHFFVHGTHARDVVMKTLGIAERKVSVVPHGHYIDAYPNTISRDEARKALGVADSASVFLFFGQIRDYKGVGDLLAAFRDPALKEATLIVAGRPQSPRLAGNLVSAAGGCSNVRLHLHFIPAEEVQVFMNAADYAVFPFREIFTSGSIMLAMSFGRKVIVPEVPSLAETIAVMNGIVFKPEQSGGLLAALVQAQQLVSHDDKGQNLQYAKSCGWDKSAAHICRVYRHLMSREGG